MHLTTYQTTLETQQRIEVQLETLTPPANLRDVDELVIHLSRANQIARLQLVDFRLVSGNVYAYRVETRDGRVWSQQLEFDAADDPAMTFLVEQGWRNREISCVANMRARVIAMYRSIAARRATVIVL
jgi:hypothetical protein